jgi:LuxR family maltose regulon positive regulatory protein
LKSTDSLSEQHPESPCPSLAFTYNRLVSEILLKSKLYMPPLRPNLVARSRLTNRFAEGLHRGCKITLISAPAGFGKTTLITACLQQTKATHHACWVSLDSTDNDLSRFLTYLIAAMQTIEPGFGAGLQATLTGLQSPDAGSLTHALLNELAAIAQPVILVLDDYHVITEPVIHSMVETLVDYLPPTIHLALTSREDPPLALPRWRVRNQLIDIRADDLRFQGQEARDFLQQTMGLDWDDTAVAQLEARTEGWAAGLQLAVLSLRGRKTPETHIESFSGSDRFVTDYLLSEVLTHQSPPMQRFLLHTSILERFDAALCNHLLDQTGSQQMLDTLEQLNLFLIPLDNQRRWYRYHHLFADLLQDRLKRDLGQAAIAKLHLRVADWFLQNGQREDAIRHTLQANDFNRTAELIATAPASMLWGQSGAGLLRQWGGALPESSLLRNPRAAFLIGAAHMLIGEIHKLQSFLALVLDAEADIELSNDLKTEISILQAILARNDGNHQEAVRMLEAARPYLPNIDLTVQNIAHLQLAINYYETGQLAKAKKEIKALQARLDQDNRSDLHMRLQTMQIEGYLARARADLTAAEQIYRSGLRLAETNASASPMVGLMLNGLGDLHFEWNEIEEASAYYHKSMELGKRTGITDISIEANLGIASIAIYQRDFNKAEAIIDDLLALIRPVDLAGLSETSSALRTSYQLRMGRLAPAVRWANASGYRLQDQPPFSQSRFTFCLQKSALSRRARQVTLPL